jgi:molybdenum cofactor synthesis domain-containing protein
VRLGILTVSDRAAGGEREDRSGPALAERAVASGWEVVRVGIVPDDQPRIEAELRAWLAERPDVILTTGGTGFSPRDRTPEATRAVVDRMAPGLAEAMRRAGAERTAHAMLSRAVAGIAERTLIVNLPGNPQAALESLEAIALVLDHAVRLLRGDPGAESGHRSA